MKRVVTWYIYTSNKIDFSIDTAGSFTVQTQFGYPTPALSVAGALPGGVSFTVTKASIAIGVSGSRVYRGGSTFVAALPSLPPGITALNGSLSGCATSVLASGDVGTYAGSISGCFGHSPAGSNAGNYQIVYVDNGFTVAAAQIAVTVTGSRPFGGSSLFSYTPPPSLPAGVTAITGTLTGCTTTLASNAAVASYPPGTIGNCGGLGLSGTDAGNFQIAYSDGGFNVASGPTGVTLVASPISAPDLYVADSGNNRVVVLPASGGSNVLRTNLSPTGVEVDAAGTVFVSNLSGDILAIPPVEPAYTVASSIPSFGIGIDPTGNIFLADTTHNRVIKVAPGGAQTTVLGTGLSSPYDVAADSAGDLFIADGANKRVIELTPSGSQSFFSTLNFTEDVAVDPAGNLFLNDGSVVKVAPSGVRTKLSTFVAPFTSIFGIALDLQGNLYMVDRPNNRVLKAVPPYNQTPEVVATGFNGPTKIAAHHPPTEVDEGDPVTLTATVISSPIGSTPPGTVTFFNGATNLGTATLNAGTPNTAVLTTTSLPGGTWALTAVYNGTTAYPASLSGPVTVIIDSDAPATVTATSTPTRTSTPTITPTSTPTATSTRTPMLADDAGDNTLVDGKCTLREAIQNANDTSNGHPNPASPATHRDTIRFALPPACCRRRSCSPPTRSCRSAATSRSWVPERRK